MMFGMGTDIPITGDWNSDGRTDIGVFRPLTRQFIFNTSPITRTTFGLNTDIPITWEMGVILLLEVTDFHNITVDFNPYLFSLIRHQLKNFIRFKIKFNKNQQFFSIYKKHRMGDLI